MNTTSTLYEFIKNARHSIRAVIHTVPSSETLQMFIDRIEEGVEVLLILDRATESTMRKDPFAFNRLMLINKKGGAVYFLEGVDKKRHLFCLLDYQKLWLGDNQVLTDKVDTATIREYLDLFSSLINDQTLYLQNNDDLKVSFDISDEVILKGDEIELHWEVQQADKVVVQKLGEVAPKGTKKLRPAVSTIFKIGVYNKDEACFRTASVKVYEDVSIDYDISFQNARTKQYSSLIKEKNYPHVYGVAQKNKIKFKWNVKDAKSVKILPFDIDTLSGVHEFTPQENMDIVIEVNIYNQKLTRRIQLLVFPIPVFTDKLLSNIPIIEQDSKVEISGLDKMAMLKKVKESQAPHNEFLKKLLAQKEERYELLNKRIEELIFDNSGKKYNLYHVNEGIFAKLERFYGKKPHIKNVIQSIKAYYDRPPEGK